MASGFGIRCRWSAVSLRSMSSAESSGASHNNRFDTASETGAACRGYVPSDGLGGGEDLFRRKYLTRDAEPVDVISLESLPVNRISAARAMPDSAQHGHVAIRVGHHAAPDLDDSVLAFTGEDAQVALHRER